MKTDLVFGCAPLGGRVPSSSGQDAVRIALDHGVACFDVARSYGFGSAERLLGEVLRPHRDRVRVYTKAGILPRAAPYAGPLFSIARRVYSFAPRLRSLVKRATSVQLQSGYLSKQNIATSLETSLRELETDRVDILFLHDASATVIQDGAVMDLLAEIRDSGRALQIGSAGPLDTGLALRSVFPDCAVQASVGELMRHAPLPGLVLGNRPLSAFERHGISSLAMPTSVLLRAPLAQGRCQAIVASMFSPEHIIGNVGAFVQSSPLGDQMLSEYLGLWNNSR